MLVAAGIFIPFVYQSRTTGDNVRCQDNFRRLWYATLHASLPGQAPPLHAAESFPAGTIDNPNLAPEQRLSFHVLTLQALELGSPAPEVPGKKKPAPRPTPLADLLRNVDIKERWDAPVNTPLAQARVRFLLCPALPASWPDESPALTQYVGLAGLGVDAASLTPEEAAKRGGVFHDNRLTPFAAVTDGLGQTMAFGETNRDLGPWLRGGPATVRGLDPEALPYLGAGRPFAGMHLHGGYFGFADGAAHFINEQVDPAVFRALLTISGNEKFDLDPPGPP